MFGISAILLEIYDMKMKTRANTQPSLKNESLAQRVNEYRCRYFVCCHDLNELANYKQFTHTHTRKFQGVIKTHKICYVENGKRNAPARGKLCLPCYRNQRTN